MIKYCTSLDRNNLSMEPHSRHVANSHSTLCHLLPDIPQPSLSRRTLTNCFKVVLADVDDESIFLEVDEGFQMKRYY